MTVVSDIFFGLKKLFLKGKATCKCIRTCVCIYFHCQKRETDSALQDQKFPQTIPCSFQFTTTVFICEVGSASCTANLSTLQSLSAPETRTSHHHPLMSTSVNPSSVSRCTTAPSSGWNRGARVWGLVVIILLLLCCSDNSHLFCFLTYIRIQ